jgi:hypothetical protein
VSLRSTPGTLEDIGQASVRSVAAREIAGYRIGKPIRLQNHCRSSVLICWELLFDETVNFRVFLYASVGASRKQPSKGCSSALASATSLSFTASLVPTPAAGHRLSLARRNHCGHALRPHLFEREKINFMHGLCRAGRGHQRSARRLLAGALWRGDEVLVFSIGYFRCRTNLAQQLRASI